VIVRTILALLAAVMLAAPGAVRAQDGTPYSRENQLDLNRATLEEIEKLPVTADVAWAILEYRTYRTYFGSLSELLNVKGMTPSMLQGVAPLVFLTPPFEMRAEDISEADRRAQDREYVLQRLLAQEGTNEALVDEYIDQIKVPRDINKLNFYDLISYQNVSPVDAVAVLNELSQSGRIENQRQLRNSPGLTYWGYRNLRDFVAYEEKVNLEKKLRADYQFRIYNTPYLLDANDLLVENIGATTSGSSEESRELARNFDLNTYAGRLDMGTTSNPWMTNKLRMAYGRHLFGTFLTHRNMGEENFAETVKFSLIGANFKKYDTPVGKFQVHRAAVGHYRLAFAQGLVMDATDFYQPRKSGFGYTLRQVGIRPDVSRTDEHALRGAAAEFTLGSLRSTLFYSQDDKDAVLNPDGSFNRYITMAPRLSNEFMAEIRQDIIDGVIPDDEADPQYYDGMRDVMNEKILGGNFKWEFTPGTYVGVTGMQTTYKNNVYNLDPNSPNFRASANRFDPDGSTLVRDTDRLLDRDAEIDGAYNSKGIGDYRRIWGAEASTVYKNLSLAGEYGKLETSTDSNAIKRIFSEGPEAFVANSMIQYENFNAMVLYRDYDVGYDNPYNRAFSEDPRYEQTLLEGNAFRLTNPYFAQLGETNAQAKSEKGWYFATRYQFSRQFTLSGLEFDTWKRKADNADLKRAVIRFQYRPVFPVQFRIRHRFSSRHEDRPDDIRQFQSWDTRLEMGVRLSRFDQVRFLFSTSNVKFASRPRLNAEAGGGNTLENQTPTRGIPARAVMGQVTHNFSQFLSMTVTTEIYDGFLYNFEDNEFVVLDGNGFRNWIMFRSRMSEHLSWGLKWTHDHQLPQTYIDVRDFGELQDPTPDADNARDDATSYRFQLDYSF